MQVCASVGAISSFSCRSDPYFMRRFLCCRLQSDERQAQPITLVTLIRKTREQFHTPTLSWSSLSLLLAPVFERLMSFYSLKEEPIVVATYMTWFWANWWYALLWTCGDRWIERFKENDINSWNKISKFWKIKTQNPNFMLPSFHRMLNTVWLCLGMHLQCL